MPSFIAVRASALAFIPSSAAFICSGLLVNADSTTTSLPKLTRAIWSPSGRSSAIFWMASLAAVRAPSSAMEPDRSTTATVPSRRPVFRRSTRSSTFTAAPFSRMVSSCKALVSPVHRTVIATAFWEVPSIPRTRKVGSGPDCAATEEIPTSSKKLASSAANTALRPLRAITRPPQRAWRTARVGRLLVRGGCPGRPASQRTSVAHRWPSGGHGNGRAHPRPFRSRTGTRPEW